MKKVYDFLKQAQTYYLATVDGDQPRVRPFGTVDIFAFKDGKWLRVAGTLVRDDRFEPKAHMLDNYPELKAMYSADDDNTEVLYFKDAEATFFSFTEAPETVRF